MPNISKKNWVFTTTILSFSVVLCFSQNPQKNISLDAAQPNNSLRASIKVNLDPQREDGYLFTDSSGNVVRYLTRKEIDEKNPYLENNLPVLKNNDTNFYDRFKGQLPIEIKRQLPDCIKSLPMDNLLKNTGLVITNTRSIDLDQEFARFLVVTYVIEFFDKHTLEQQWAETTIHIYDAKGNLTAVIIDSINIQGTYISATGKFLLANEVFYRIGDGVSEIYTGLVLYSIREQRRIYTFKNMFVDYFDNFMSVKADQFTFYGTSTQNLIIDGNTEYSPMKIRIDPNEKLIYTQNYQLGEKPQAMLNKSLFFDFDKENFDDYQKLKF